MNDSNPIKDFLSEAASTILQETRADFEAARQEVSQLSFALKEVSSECTHLRGQLTLLADKHEVALAEVDAQEKQKYKVQQELAVQKQRKEELEHQLPELKQRLAVQTKRKEELEQQLSEFKHQLVSQDNEKVKTREEVINLENQLHLQVKVNDELHKKLDVLRLQLEQASQQLSKKESEANLSTEEAKLSLLQLRQLQDELENFFLISRKQSKMLVRSEALNKKVVNMLFAMIS